MHSHSNHSRQRSKDVSQSTSTKSSLDRPAKPAGLAKLDIGITDSHPTEVTESPISRNASFNALSKIIRKVGKGSNASAGSATNGTTSTAPSTSGSQVDLTKPIINTTSAELANDEDLNNSDLESEASSSSCSSDYDSPDQGPSVGVVTVQGREPAFSRSKPSTNIVAERISTHGKIREFEPIAQIPALDPRLRESIGQIHGGDEGAIHRWLAKREEWDKKFASQHEKWRKIKIADKAQAEQAGFLTRDLQGERPPLCSLVGWYDHDLAREVGKSVDEISGKTSKAMLMWQRMSEKVRKTVSSVITYSSLIVLAGQGTRWWREHAGDQGECGRGYSESVSISRFKATISFTDHPSCYLEHCCER